MSGQFALSRILVCDDDAPFRQRLSRSLRTAGYTVFEARDAREALEAAVEFQPDGILVDMRMPGEGGLWLVPRVRESLPHARIVVLTGFGSIATALDAVRLGATNYLTKPSPVSAIIAAFTPELFGNGQIGQFATFAQPALGFWLAIVGVVLAIVANIVRARVCAHCGHAESCSVVCPRVMVLPERKKGEAA